MERRPKHHITNSLTLEHLIQNGVRVKKIDYITTHKRNFGLAIEKREKKEPMFCLKYVLSHPAVIVAREDHTEGFRKSEEYKEWKKSK